MNAATAHQLFLENRRAYIGGTDIAAITGVSQWASPLSVYLDKTDPERLPDKDSLPMRRGLALEQFIADEYERARPGFVTYKPRPVVRLDWGFPAGASIDRMVATAKHPRTPIAILECKTAFRDGWRTWDEDAGDIPDSYFVQVQWYLAVTDLPVVYGAADIGADKLSIIPFEADVRVQARLIEAGREFWTQHVETLVPPAPIGTEADHEALTRMWPETVPEPAVTIEDELADVILSDYMAHKFVAEQEKREAELAKQRLQALMGENEQAVVGKWRLTWKRQSKTLIDATRLKAERPDIAAEYAKTSESRVFGAPKEVEA